MCRSRGHGYELARRHSIEGIFHGEYNLLIEGAHEHYVSPRRIKVLAEHLASLVPQGQSILDVGCGDGLLDKSLLERRPDLNLAGIDVFVRAKTYLPVLPYDGKTIPYTDNSFDCVMFIDVLHHTSNIRELLQEAIRVARRSVVIKDHCANGRLDRRLLTFMDYVGNARFGVARPTNYLTAGQWSALFADLKLKQITHTTRLHLYPWFADWLFGRSLHFLTLLEPSS